MNKWNKYFKSNTFDEYNKMRFDCQLVNAINAAIYFYDLNIPPNSNYYKELLELGGCNFGPCFKMENVWEELGIWEDERLMSWDFKDYLKSNCFLELNVWHKDTHFHSCSIVDYAQKSDACRVTNFKQVTSNKGWIFTEDLEHYLTSNRNKSYPLFVARTFRAIK